MPKKDAIEIAGRVVDLLPDTVFRVQLSNGHRILARASGRVRMNFTRIQPGDTVTVEMSPHDLSRGRITTRQGSQR